jgi:hypothetical protein
MPRSGRRRARSAERRSCAGASGRPAPPRRREAARISHTKYAGSRFDGPLRAVLAAHKRAGERAAATQSDLGGTASLSLASESMAVEVDLARGARERVELGPMEKGTAEGRWKSTGKSGGRLRSGFRRRWVAAQWNGRRRCWASSPIGLLDSVSAQNARALAQKPNKFVWPNPARECSYF